jgi:hypothetical protein
MKRPHRVLFALSFLLTAPVIAQTQIGGGTCSSSTLSGNYDFTITGRQVTSAGNFPNVLQANGSANFDGQSKVTLTMTANTLQSVATPVTWAGTYSVQANCAGAITITSGGSVTLNLVMYGQGANFLVTGDDAIYNYSGSGSAEPSSCTAATLSGVYTFTGTGYGLSGSSVSAAEDGTGLLQFDGVSNLTVNLNTSLIGKPPAALTLTGSYSISSNCLGSATLTDSTKANTYVVSFSVTNSSVANGAFDATLAQNGKLLISGNGHAIFGQPAAAAADHRAGRLLAADVLEMRLSEAVYGWGI